MPTIPAGARRVAIIVAGPVLLTIIIIVAITNTTDEQTADATTWRQIAGWSDIDQKTTEQFAVGDNWAIKWSATSNKFGAGYFTLTLYTAAGDHKAVLAKTMRGGVATINQDEAGTYYLDIDCGDPWSVEVWDKR